MIVILASPCVGSQVPRWVHPRRDKELEGLFRGRQTLEAVPSPAQPRLAPRSGALLSPASLNLKPEASEAALLGLALPVTGPPCSGR